MPSNHLILCCPVSSCPQSFPASSSFPTSQLFTSDGESIGASASVLPLPRSTDLLRVTTNPECFIPSASLSSENCRELASIFSSQMHGCGVLEVARALSAPPQLSCHLPTAGSGHTSLISWTMTAPCQASGRTSARTVAGPPRLLSAPCPPTWQPRAAKLPGVTRQKGPGLLMLADTVLVLFLSFYCLLLGQSPNICPPNIPLPKWVSPSTLYVSLRYHCNTLLLQKNCLKEIRLSNFGWGEKLDGKINI